MKAAQPKAALVQKKRRKVLSLKKVVQKPTKLIQKEDEMSKADEEEAA